MTARKPIPHPINTRPFSVEEARAAGVSPSRVRSRDLSAPFPGVRVAKPDVSAADSETDFAWATRRMVRLAQEYAPRLKPGQYFCEMTAIALHGLPIPLSRLRDEKVHVAVPFPRSAPRARGMIGHQFSVDRVVRTDGLPVAAPVDAWIDCAGRCSVEELVIIGDGLLRRQDPFATGEDLAAAVRAHENRPGIRKLRQALARIRGGTDSAMETVIRLLIVDNGLPEPFVNPVIFDQSGLQLAIADLGYLQWKVLIEYQGDYHFRTPDQRRKDVDRIAALVRARWHVIEVHKDHIFRNPNHIIALIRDALLDAGWRP